MKKIFLSLSLVFLAENLSANNFNDNIQKLIGNSVKVINVVEVENTNYMLLVVDENGKNNFLLSDKAGEMIFSSFIPNERMKIELEKALSKTKFLKESDKKLIEIVKKIPENAIIKLDSDDKNSKKITFLLTDVDCPFCKEEFKTIKNRLKSENVVVIFTPVKGINSLKKSAYILNKVQTLKTSEEKYNLLKDFFEDKVINYENDKIEQKININDVANVKDLIFGSTKIDYVPYTTTIIVDENK